MTQFDPSDQSLTREAAFARLSFCVEAGVSDNFADEVQNRYQQEPDAPAAASVTAPASGDASRRALPRMAATSAMSEAPAAGFQGAAPVAITMDDNEAITQARSLAARATTLDELRTALESFDGCSSLRNTAKNLVFGAGNPNARLMLVGDAPGTDDDLDGAPFSGDAGRLLDRMLAAIGLARDEVYLAHLLPWRPPGKRPPTPSELAMCEPFITRQIELCAPDVLVCMGGLAAKQLLNVETPLLRLRGQWKTYAAKSETNIPTISMFPPDYLLKQPAHKRLAWGDLLAVKGKLG